MSPSLISAYVWLSLLEFDLAEYRDAAASLTQLEEAIDRNDQSRRLFNDIIRDARGELPDRKTLMARRHYYLACQFREEGDWSKQREHLQAAIEKDGTDADVMIAIYRLHGADDAWRADVRQRILRLSKVFQKSIEEDPEDSITYNQWAWLISNTEGDFDQSLRYSKKSLELVPDEPGYLDTLGRCYYAKGDLASAVKYQRRAVELEPHMQVMRRQLELFESTLAASQTKD